MATKAQTAPTENGTSQWWPSKYGADDQAGALNEITPAKVLEAVRPASLSTPVAVLGETVLRGARDDGCGKPRDPQGTQGVLHTRTAMPVHR